MERTFDSGLSENLNQIFLIHVSHDATSSLSLQCWIVMLLSYCHTDPC